MAQYTQGGYLDYFSPQQRHASPYGTKPMPSMDPQDIGAQLEQAKPIYGQKEKDDGRTIVLPYPNGNAERPSANAQRGIPAGGGGGGGGGGFPTGAGAVQAGAQIASGIKGLYSLGEGAYNFATDPVGTIQGWGTDIENAFQGAADWLGLGTPTYGAPELGFAGMGVPDVGALPATTTNVSLEGLQLGSGLSDAANLGGAGLTAGAGSGVTTLGGANTIPSLGGGISGASVTGGSAGAGLGGGQAAGAATGLGAGATALTVAGLIAAPTVLGMMAEENPTAGLKKTEDGRLAIDWQNNLSEGHRDYLNALVADTNARIDEGAELPDLLPKLQFQGSGTYMLYDSDRKMQPTGHPMDRTSEEQKYVDALQQRQASPDGLLYGPMANFTVEDDDQRNTRTYGGFQMEAPSLLGNQDLNDTKWRNAEGKTPQEVIRDRAHVWGNRHGDVSWAPPQQSVPQQGPPQPGNMAPDQPLGGPGSSNYNRSTELGWFW